MATDGKVNRWNATYNAADERLLDSSLWMPGAPSAPFSARSGRRVNGAGLAVSVGGGPEAWTVTAGAGVIYDAAYSAQGPFRFEIPTAIGPVTMPARPGVGLSRIDLIVARIYDVDILVGAVKEIKIEIKAGDAAASPVAPSMDPLSLLLATLTVPNVGAITVVQTTAVSVAAGGILPVATTAERDDLATASIAYRGLVVDNAQTGLLERYNGTAWKQLQEVAADTGWVAVPFIAGYAEFNNTNFSGKIRKIGQQVHMIGLVKPTSGNFAAGTSVNIATLAAAYRPTTVDEAWTAATGTASTLSRNVLAASTGVIAVQPAAAVSYVSLSWSWMVG